MIKMSPPSAFKARLLVSTVSMCYSAHSNVQRGIPYIPFEDNTEELVSKENLTSVYETGLDLAESTWRKKQLFANERIISFPF